MIKNRSEILFLYDVRDANPNGDPLDENKPRIDEETGVNLVTDVRLKRTIRDYLYDFRNMEVFVRGTRDSKGDLRTKEERLGDLNVSSGDELLERCVDIRLFGATAAIKKKSIIFTGPVQFKLGRSLHRVKLEFVKGTTVMPSAESRKQGTFTEEYRLPYSLICFYGIVNENAARWTKLTEEDLHLLLDGLWNGTKNLISRSKAGQTPRLLLKVNYREGNYHIGDLNSLLSLEKEVADEELRDISQVKLDLTRLVEALEREKERIESVEYLADRRVRFLCQGEEVGIEDCLEKAGIQGKVIEL